MFQFPVMELYFDICPRSRDWVARSFGTFQKCQFLHHYQLQPFLLVGSCRRIFLVHNTYQSQMLWNILFTGSIAARGTYKLPIISFNSTITPDILTVMCTERCTYNKFIRFLDFTMKHHLLCRYVCCQSVCTFRIHTNKYAFCQIYINV